MVQEGFDGLRERQHVVDLENGTNALIDEEGSRDANAVNLLNRVWNGFVSPDMSSKSEENVSLGNYKLTYVESPFENGRVLIDKRYGGGEEVSPVEKKKSSKKPPKPPRPPRPTSMDPADQKLVREFSEAAMKRRAKTGPMKRAKNAKPASSGGNLVALIVTIIFCFVIIWQGLFPRSGSNASLQGSSESPLGARGGFISVQFYKNTSSRDDSSSASPNNVQLMSGLDDHGQARNTA